MALDRLLIVNADDFGLSPGINRGVIRAHEEGIVTSASLMVRQRAAAAAASYARRHPALSVGLHLDFGEWVYGSGQWAPLYQVLPEESAAAFEMEIRRQLQTFRRLTGNSPTHIDSHQHRHLREPARSLLLEVACELGVPLRGCSPQVGYCGEFFGQSERGLSCPENITPGRLLHILAGLPPGITELSCHPGQGDHLDGVYGKERREELKVLCDPRIAAAIQEMQIELCSFRGVCAPPVEAAA